MAYASVNPFTNEVEKTFPDATDEEVDQAIARAHAAFGSWRSTTFAERAAIMRRAAALFRERHEDIARIVTAEMGLTWEFSKAMAGEMAAGMLEYYADNAEELLKPEPLQVKPHEGSAYVVYQPLGVIFAVEPWNAPVYQAVRPATTNLMAGNTVILKHASNIPRSADAVAEVFRDAGVPDGVFINIRANHEQTARIIADPRVRGVTLTGSDTAGARIAEQAGRNIKPSVLELGGSDAMIVLDDADVDNAAQCSMFRFALAGQGCGLPKRMICVGEATYEKFLARYTELIEAMTIGDPMDPAVTLGPVSSQAAADQVKDQIRRAVEGGATATTAGTPVPERGAFVQPTILTGLTRDNPVFYEEVFGPVPIIFKVDSEDEAVALANDSVYGLAGSVYSADVERAQRVAMRLDTGLVAINMPSNAYDDMPFGGTKRSGYGKEMGPHGIKEFVLTKCINVAPVAS